MSALGNLPAETPLPACPLCSSPAEHHDATASARAGIRYECGFLLRGERALARGEDVCPKWMAGHREQLAMWLRARERPHTVRCSGSACEPGTACDGRDGFAAPDLATAAARWSAWVDEQEQERDDYERHDRECVRGEIEVGRSMSHPSGWASCPHCERNGRRAA